MGDCVICDMCGEDFTNRKEAGGFTFGSKAVCPLCAPGIEASAIAYGEACYIRERCPAGMEFRRWVIDVLRGGKPGVSTVVSIGEEP
jgi:hypothetical protein